ncbi:hypothetical protein GW17_00023389 [Ensete ventricosum]|nr:hypothetical protein GW17_00023389 [Ensete ventricosum]
MSNFTHGHRWSQLRIQPSATFRSNLLHLKHHMCNNLAIEKVIHAAHKESSNFHHLRDGVIGQRVHFIVGQLGLFIYGFIFKFKIFFRWYGVLVLYWFDDEELPLLQRCSRHHSSSQCQHNPLANRS